MAHVVTAGAARVSRETPDGGAVMQILRRGDLVPGDVDSACVKHLLGLGLIAEVKDEQKTDKPRAQRAEAK